MSEYLDIVLTAHPLHVENPESIFPTPQAVSEDVRYFPLLDDPMTKLHSCRKQTPKRTWRRWRGKIKAGKWANVPEVMIYFDGGRLKGLPTPFLNDDYALAANLVKGWRDRYSDIVDTWGSNRYRKD